MHAVIRSGPSKYCSRGDKLHNILWYKVNLSDINDNNNDSFAVKMYRNSLKNFADWFEINQNKAEAQGNIC